MKVPLYVVNVIVFDVGCPCFEVVVAIPNVKHFVG
jgi:hypothetical protein